MRLRRTAVPVLALLVLTGCGSSSGTSTSAGSPAASSAASNSAQSGDSDALVQAATAKTTATSSKLTLTSRTQLGGQDVAFVGKGGYDYAAKKGTFSFQLPKGAGGGTIEERLIGNALYLSLPQQKGAFYKVGLDQVAGTSLSSTTDPAAPLEVLKALKGAKKQGTEQVRGVTATKYTGTINVKDALAQSGGASKQLLQNSFGKLGVTSFPVTVYLDDQGRVVKYSQVLDLPNGLKSTTSLEVYDFGAPVSVTAPPAAAVRDGAPLIAALKSAAGRAKGGAPGGAKPAPVASPTP